MCAMFRPPRVLPSNVTSFTTDEPLQLMSGATYRIRVTAVSGAGLKTVQYTDGVIIDTTPPKVDKHIILGSQIRVINCHIIFSHYSPLVIISTSLWVSLHHHCPVGLLSL